MAKSHFCFWTISSSHICWTMRGWHFHAGFSPERVLPCGIVS
nr:MAG TPA: hypothetical protein [Caudoviricetes sp.]